MKRFATISWSARLPTKGEKLKLADQSPWKEQIEDARRKILTNATLSHELNGYVVPEPDVQQYFEANQGSFQQVTVKMIKVGFNPNFKPSDTSNETLAEAAQAVIAAAHSPNRSEADAKKLADDLAHQARGGVDFAQLAQKYSDDEDHRQSRRRFRRHHHEHFICPMDLSAPRWRCSPAKSATR